MQDVSFSHNARVSQTDRQTDDIMIIMMAVAFLLRDAYTIG